MTRLIALATLSVLASAAQSLQVVRDIPYAQPAQERQMLDVHAPDKARNLPVVFWIHGGGWTAGSKNNVHAKPQAFANKGFVFVSTNYRFVPHVDMYTLTRDVAKAIRWVSDNIATYGGDPTRIFLMGWSAGGQLAALLCTDDRYLKAEGLPLSIVKGCVAIDGDSYDVPLIVETAAARRKARGQPPSTAGHDQKFGNDPVKHRDLSAVNHVARNKGIPPFLLLHVADNANTTVQAQRMAAVLTESGIPARVFGVSNTTHAQIDADLGVPDYPATKPLFEFVDGVMKKK
jgi:acetyl esterase/lipase